MGEGENSVALSEGFAPGASERKMRDRNCPLGEPPRAQAAARLRGLRHDGTVAREFTANVRERDLQRGRARACGECGGDAGGLPNFLTGGDD
jgi:hypothetical protein